MWCAGVVANADASTQNSATFEEHHFIPTQSGQGFARRVLNVEAAFQKRYSASLPLRRNKNGKTSQTAAEVVCSFQDGRCKFHTDTNALSPAELKTFRENDDSKSCRSSAAEAFSSSMHWQSKRFWPFVMSRLASWSI